VQAEEKKRIYFLDMMRALAVLMMVEGHTVDAFLSDSFRNSDSLVYTIWLGIRGFTAPIFMFTSGVVFTYLLLLNKKSFFENPRVKKGFFRFITLVVIAYLLRYPTYTFFDFSLVTRTQWMVFFTVDALHLIGFGLFFILILTLIKETINVKEWIAFLAGALFFFGMFFITESIRWTDYMPAPFAAYFYHKTGSFFPFFPWAGYVIAGAVLGSYLAHNPGAFSTINFSKKLLYIGSAIFSVSILFDIVEKAFFIGNVDWIDKIVTITLRVGIVIILNGIMSFIATRINKIPELVKQIGRHTLLIYAVHVVILYGSAWLPGMDQILHKKLNVLESVVSAVLLILLMIFMVIILERIKLHIKNKTAAAEN